MSTFYAAAQKDMAIFCMQGEAEKTERGEEGEGKRGSGTAAKRRVGPGREGGRRVDERGDKLLSKQQRQLK